MYNPPFVPANIDHILLPLTDNTSQVYSAYLQSGMHLTEAQNPNREIHVSVLNRNACNS